MVRIVRPQKIILYVIVTIIFAAILVPYLWTFLSSVSLTRELVKYGIPRKLIFDNYRGILFPRAEEISWIHFRHGLLNSFIVASGTTIVCLVVAFLAGYAYSRFLFRGKEFSFFLLLGMQVIPSVVIAVPAYIIGRTLGLLDTRFFLILMNCSFILPIAIWLMRNYFDTIPKDLDDAARIDGCSIPRIIVCILLPIAAPGVVTTSLFCFILAWNEFLYALLFTSTMRAKTVTVVATEFIRRDGIVYDKMCAAGFFSTLVPVALALVFQKYIRAGIGKGAIK